MLALALFAGFILTPLENAVDSDDGTAHLAWAGVEEDAASYELEHKRPDEGRRVYPAGRSDFYVSGLRGGEHRFRIRPAGGEWSRPLIVRVEYPDSRMVASLLVLGLLVFGTTVAVVFRAARRNA